VPKKKKFKKNQQLGEEIREGTSPSLQSGYHGGGPGRLAIVVKTYLGGLASKYSLRGRRGLKREHIVHRKIF